MTTGESLLAAVIADPADDLPRLVYADWLDDTGTDPDRAEFIRLQCGPPSAAAEERAHELLRRNRPRWVIPDLPQPTVQEEFDRGFVAGIHTTADLFLEGADRIGTEAPVSSLQLSYCVGRFDRLAEVPWLSRVDELDLTNNVGLAGEWDAFLRVPLRHLKSLQLRNCQLWPIDLDRLAASADRFPRLERLNLSGNPIGDEGITHLAGVRFVTLRELTLRCDMQQFIDAIHAAGAAALAGSRLLDGVTHLDLAGHYIGEAGLMELAESGGTDSLEWLDVSANTIGQVSSRGVEAVVESSSLCRLRVWNLCRNTIDRLAADALAEWPHAASMERINLSGCAFGPTARERLDQSPHRIKFLMDDPEKSETEGGTFDLTRPLTSS